MQLLAHFVSAAAILHRDPAAMALDITRSSTLEPILQQVRGAAARPRLNVITPYVEVNDALRSTCISR
jgi:hypothetical protein